MYDLYHFMLYYIIRQYQSLLINKEAYKSFFFFFQAEDGIRDATVTGVQTLLFRSGLSRCSSSPWSRKMPLQEKQTSTSTPRYFTSCIGNPHFGQCIQWSSFSRLSSVDSFSFFACSASFRFFSASSRSKYSSSLDEPFPGVPLSDVPISSALRVRSWPPRPPRRPDAARGTSRNARWPRSACPGTCRSPR